MSKRRCENNSHNLGKALMCASAATGGSIAAGIPGAVIAVKLALSAAEALEPVRNFIAEEQCVAAHPPAVQQACEYYDVQQYPVWEQKPTSWEPTSYDVRRQKYSRFIEEPVKAGLITIGARTGETYLDDAVGETIGAMGGAVVGALTF